MMEKSLTLWQQFQIEASLAEVWHMRRDHVQEGCMICEAESKR